MTKLLNTTRRQYLNPAVYATLAGAYAEESATLTGRAKATATKRFNECMTRGIEAALIVALDLPIPVNPHH